MQQILLKTKPSANLRHMAHILIVYPERVAYRRLHTMRQAGSLFGRAIRRREIELFNGVTDTLSVEAGHIPPFPRNLYQYAQFVFL